MLFVNSKLPGFDKIGSRSRHQGERIQHAIYVAHFVCVDEVHSFGTEATDRAKQGQNIPLGYGALWKRVDLEAAVQADGALSVRQTVAKKRRKEAVAKEPFKSLL